MMSIFKPIRIQHYTDAHLRTDGNTSQTSSLNIGAFRDIYNENKIYSDIETQIFIVLNYIVCRYF